MSQVKFRAVHDPEGKATPVEVMAGWDRPTRGFFMTVFDLTDADDPNAEEKLLYNGLDDRNTIMGNMPTTEYFQMLLKAFGIQAPEGFWERVERQEGNVFHNYNPEKGEWS
jgi:hypothetical protein